MFYSSSKREWWTCRPDRSSQGCSDGICKEQGPFLHICEIVFMWYILDPWFGEFPIVAQYVSTLENSRVLLGQLVANLFITVSFGFWWVFSFLMEKSNWRRFNRASIQRSLNFLRVLLEIFHFNLSIQPVFQKGDYKKSFFPSVGIVFIKIAESYICGLNDVWMGFFFILGSWIKVQIYQSMFG